MALRQVTLSHKIEELRGRMKPLSDKREELRSRRAQIDAREKELEEATNETNEETSAEDRAALEAEIDKWDAEEKALAEEERQNGEETDGLQRQIDALQSELDEINQRARSAMKTPEGEVRKDEKKMNTRKFYGMTHQERDEFFANSDVKRMLSNVRAAISEKRAISGADAIIPTVVLDLVRERMGVYSKLLKHVNVQRVKGDARVPIMGVAPEAVWTEMCGELNEIDLSFGSVTMDGYKVGAYIRVCNAVLEDNDVDLAAKIIEAIGKAMGKAIDKAILYGAGGKMPTGILTALLAGEYADTNVIAITGKTGIELFQALVEAIGETDNEYSTGGLFWAMNTKTKTKLMTNAMSFNAAGAIVTGQQNVMPIVDGAIETLGFIPDDVIIGGYGELYAMLERAGMTFARSEHVRFIQDETVFKGTARYDGKPVIEKGFVAIGIGGVKPTTDGVTFAEDKANAA